MPSKTLAKVIRGETVESVHRGSFIILDGDGSAAASAGDPRMMTFFRSAAKPLQAIPLITSGAADAFGFSEEEIALACASHSGESRHVRIVELMLGRLDLTEAHLRCGAHLPFFEKEAERMQRAGEYPTQLHNNCSGKHAGMLAVAKHLGAPIGSYESPDNPVQKEILGTVETMTGVPSKKIGLGVDGCAAPIFAVPLEAMARSFLNLVSPPDHFEPGIKTACARIVSAMSKFPELIGGSERLDTMLMQAAEGRIISKVGAEGVWLCGVLPSDKHPSGLSIALKIEDGDDRRARPVAAVAILKQLGLIADESLSDLSPMLLKNRRGDAVGSVAPVIDLAA
ncbi:MAG: asparaginase [Chloracidobacterium sp.]|nr:asparaginase [Chloracidobacterium sp.]